MAPIVDLQAFVDWNGDGLFTGTYDNISAYLRGDETLMRITRSISLPGGQGSPGSLSLVLANPNNLFTRGNLTSPLAGEAIPGRPIKVQAVYSGTTYPLFYGWIRRIVPLPGYPLTAQIVAEDALFRYSRRETSLPLLNTRSIADVRNAAFDDIGEPSANRLLATSGPEAMITPSGADQRNVLDLLGDLNTATGTVHFVRPVLTAEGYDYVTKQRADLLAASPVKSYAATEIESWGNYETSDESIINLQNVEAQPWLSGLEEQMLWQREGRIAVAAGATRTIWANWNDPLIFDGRRRPAESVRYEDAGRTGTATVAVTYFETSAKVVFSGGASGGTVTDPTLYGYPAQQQGLGFAQSRRQSSIDTYGEWRGQDLRSEFLSTYAEAEGRGDYVTYLYRQPRSQPSIRLRKNLLPDILQREPAERIQANNGMLGLVNRHLIIESVEIGMDPGGIWSAALGCQEIDAPLLTFTVGGTAAQGVGGTGILGY